MECVRKIGSSLFRSVFMGSRVFGATKRDYCARPVGEKDPAGSEEPVVSVGKAHDNEDESDYEAEIRYYKEEIERQKQWEAGFRPKPLVSDEDLIRAGLPVYSDEQLARWRQELWDYYINDK